jgi:hypothetical protein
VSAPDQKPVESEVKDESNSDNWYLVVAMVLLAVTCGVFCYMVYLEMDAEDKKVQSEKAKNVAAAESQVPDLEQEDEAKPSDA